jgi:hypothetical protein
MSSFLASKPASSTRSSIIPQVSLGEKDLKQSKGGYDMDMDEETHCDLNEVRELGDEETSI